MKSRWILNKYISLKCNRQIRILSYLILFAIFIIPFISASDLNLKINGQINGYSSDVVIKTNSNALSGLDAYDFEQKTNPDNYSVFYTNTSTNGLVIDTSSTGDRNVYLVYSISDVQTGTINFSWDLLNGDYDGNFTFYGDDSTYTTAISSVNMRSSSSLSTSIASETALYAKVALINYVPPASCGDGICNNGESCISCSGDCGACAASTSGGSSGGGGGGSVAKKEEIVIDQTIFEVPTIINTAKSRKFVVSNPGTKTMQVKIFTRGDENILDVPKEFLLFELAPGEKKEIDFRVIAPEEPGIYTQKILVNGKEILVSTNVNTKELLFDASVVIPQNLKTLTAGKNLESQVTLIPMGENPRLDVTVNYIIKDFTGKTIFTESETFLVEGQKNFNKEFSTENIPPGDYVLGIEVVYPNGVATSTSHFLIKKEGKEIAAIDNTLLLLIFLGTGILLVGIWIIVFIVKYKKMRKFKNKLKKRRK